MSQIGELENERIGPILAPPVVSTKTSRRFYEVIVLLLALNKGYKSTFSKKSNDLPHSTGENSDEDLFHNFVSRLGQICDSRPGGSTVTAFAVLQRPDKVEYVFGCNGRKTVELETTKAYISAILTSLKESSSCEDDEQREKYLSNLLGDILVFNRVRIQRYLNGLMDALQECIAIYGTESSKTAMSRQKSFVQILELVNLANPRDNDDDEFLEHTEKLIKALQSLQTPATALFLRRKASNDKVGNPGPWQDLQHHSSRILAYRRAVEALWESGCMWPSLFDTFKVTYIPSSTKAANPLCTSPQTASDILNRMIPSSVETKRQYLDLAETMKQNFELDKVIEDIWTSKSFKPLIHAEILVLNWLEKDGGTRPERFFSNWQYIGCSKPVCKLCHYYVSSHPSGVQTRGTHGNLYRNWRMPDLADVHGLSTQEEVQTKRSEILQGIMGQLKQCVLRTLSEKVAEYRPFDSNTTSSFARNGGLFGMDVLDQNSLVSRTRLSSLSGSQAGDFNEDKERINGESETGGGVGKSLETEVSSSVNGIERSEN